MAWLRPFGFGGLLDWNPVRELDRMWSDMDAIFGRAERSYASGESTVNVWAKDDGAVVTAELPGVDPERIDISVKADVVTLKGSKPEDKTGEGERLLRRERGHGEFSREIRLPFRVAEDAVEARFRNGVLHLRLPRASADQARRIPVQPA